MNKRKIALGPGAASLILIVVVLSLCMLAMLAQIGARNDYSLSSRSAENLPEDMTLDEDVVSWSEPLDNRTMNCEVKILDPGESPRAKWISYKLKVDEPEEDWEW